MWSLKHSFLDPQQIPQRYFKRELERQWYERLVKLALAKNNFSGEIPVRDKHVWKPIRTSDIYAMETAVANLYGNGLGILAEYPEFAFDMMGWDKKTLLEKQNPTQPSAPKKPSMPEIEPIKKP
jgi:hypothetical protein